MPEPNPTPPDRPQDTPHDPRPDLRLVAPDPEPARPATADPDADRTPPAAGATVNGEMKPLAPLDQQFLAHARMLFQTMPRWAERPPALAEIWDYSTNGDWTTEEKSAKRLAHALIVVLTFAALYPVSWTLQLALHKPIGFVITVAVLFVIYQFH